MMLNKQIVSIIIPIYNMEGTIGACLESVLNQTYTNFEILIIDDGSTDNSKNVIDTYCKLSPKITYYYQSNAGVSSARNKGIALSNGAWLLFVDADDSIAPDFIENIFSQIEREDDIAIVGLTKIFNDGTHYKVEVPKLGKIIDSDFFCDFAYQQQKNGVYGFVSTKVINSEIVKKFQLTFNETLKLAEDLDFFMQYYSHCKQFKFIDEYGYFYTQETEKSPKEPKEVDYLQLIQIYNAQETMLLNVGYLNASNKKVIASVKSHLKSVYFNEMTDITNDAIENGLTVLADIELIQSSRISDTILKWLIAHKFINLIRLYLKIRLAYINFKRIK